MLRVSPKGLTRLLLCANPLALAARRHAHAVARRLREHQRDSPPHRNSGLGHLPNVHMTADATKDLPKKGGVMSKSEGKEVLGLPSSTASCIQEVLLESSSEATVHLSDHTDSLASKNRKKPTSSRSGAALTGASLRQRTDSGQTSAIEEGADTFVPHQSHRASLLAARNMHKVPDAHVASLRGARVYRHHRHALAYMHHLAVSETLLPVLAKSQGQGSRIDLSILNISQMIQTLEGLTQDEIPARYKDEGLRIVLLSFLASTVSPQDAWDAYHLLTLLPNAKVPFAHLHRLVRLLSTQRPRTRRVFLRVLSVLRALHAAGGSVKTWEWNLLVDAAGKGTHKIHLEDFRTALAVFDDMRGGRAPGATFLSAGRAERVENRSFSPNDDDCCDAEHAWGTDSSYTTSEAAGARNADPGREPDIYTYTSLLSLATLTHDSRALHRISNLRFTIPPNTVTHSVLLSLFAKRGDWASVRGALHRLGPLDQKAFGVALWAFASAGRTHVAERMYAFVRAHASEKERLGRELYVAEDIQIQDTVVPDAGAYHALIQAYAYHGDLSKCLKVFQEMLMATAHMPPHSISHSQACTQTREAKEIERAFEPTLAVFRAIFLGFYRHGTDSRSPQALWTLPRLLPILSRFLALPPGARPKRTLLFWILTALWRTSGRDAGIVLDAADKLQARFGGRWTGRLENMRVMVERVVRAGERVNITRRERDTVDEEDDEREEK